MFNINFTYLINLLLPPNLRKPKQIAWLKVLLSYLKLIYENFIVYRTEKLYDINFTGQTMYLEKKLQDMFNIPSLYIADGTQLDYFYLYKQSEGEIPVYFYEAIEGNAQYLYNHSEYIYSGAFIIFIPLADYLLLSAEDLKKLDKIVNYYKLIDKNYLIKTY